MHHAYGLVRTSVGDPPRVAVRDGQRVVLARNIPGLPAAIAGATSLEPLLRLGRSGWDDVHGTVAEHLATGAGPSTSLDAVEALLPIDIGDYVDFYASEHHATNVGRLFRPDGDPLLPNWKHLPVGYHGRAGSIVVAGTPIRRPSGVLGPGRFGPSERLDLELELGFVVGTDVAPGRVVAPDGAGEVVFGVALVNDWSARDIQAFEYQPLGPFNGKAFATSMAAWITPLAALPRTAGPAQDPRPIDALASDRGHALDVQVSWSLGTGGSEPTILGSANVRDLYWSFAQMVAHLTSGGAGLRSGDLFASGTISGAGEGARGCLLEATANGAEPVRLDDGAERTWLADGDTVTLTGGWDGGELAPVSGTIVSAPDR